MMRYIMNSKDMLAKLLATENIRVIRGNVNTASFNVETRVLKLPIWKDMSSNVEDLMIGHEVGHALYTDDYEFATLSPLRKTIFNILEDNRIERMIKSTYPGLKANFSIGYKELYDNDFFGDEFDNFLDKVNVASKVGIYANIEFDGKEEELFNLANKTKLISDVYKLTEIYYEYIKNETDDNESSDKINESSDKIPELTKSQSIFDSEISKLVDTTTTYSYVNFDDISFRFTENQNGIIGYKRMLELWDPSLHVSNTSGRYNKFMLETSNIVNHMTSIFTMKQSAETRKREQEYKSGELNMSKLFGYKTSDNIFKTYTESPTGKNHGLIILLDLSGSIESTLSTMFKQVVTLVLFCRRNRIKHSVFGFVAGGAAHYHRDCETRTGANIGSLLLEIFSDRMNTHEFTLMSKLITTKKPEKYGLQLCSTPLNISLASFIKFLPEYKISNNIDKLSMMILTDGESDGISSLIGNFNKNDGRSAIVIHDDVTKHDYEFVPKMTQLEITEKLITAIKNKIDVLVGYIYIQSDSAATHNIQSTKYHIDKLGLTEIKQTSKVKEFKGKIIDKVYIADKLDLNVDNKLDESDDVEESFMSNVEMVKNSRMIMNSFINLIS